MEYMIHLLAAGAAGLFAAALFALVQTLAESMPEDNREYMDPLPPGLKLIWPLVRVVAYYATANLPQPQLERIETRLNHTGVAYLLTADQFVAVRIIGAVGVTLMGLVMLMLLPDPEWIWLLFAPFAGFFFPDVWLHDTRKRREAGVIRQMPTYLDFITMAVEAGLNLSGALQQAREKGPSGPVRNEFGIVLRDIRSGLNRADALRRMAERLNITEVTSFVSAVIQAERMGSSLGGVLRTQAEQRRIERFQRAEKLAMEAPVKLVGPLIMFIFPVTFIVIGFPLVMKFMAEGIM